MNDNLLYDKELKIKNKYIRLRRNVGVPALVLLGFMILGFLLIEVDDSPGEFLYRIFYFSFSIITTSLYTAYASSLMGKIKVRTWGLGVEPLLWGNQNVRWDQITSIEQENQTIYPMVVKFLFNTRVWKVTTDIKPRFSLSKKTTVSFYITNWHEYYEELLELIHEQSGVEIPSLEPPRKYQQGMNDNLIYGKKLKNRSEYIRRIATVSVVFHCLFIIYVLVSAILTWALAKAIAGAPIIFVFYVLSITYTFIHGSLSTAYLYRLMGTIKVRTNGVEVETRFRGNQNVQWAQIKTVQREYPKIYRRARKLEIDIRVWKVITDIKPKFSLSKKTTVCFYITNWHDYYEELLELIHEQSGVEIPSLEPVRFLE